MSLLTQLHGNPALTWTLSLFTKNAVSYNMALQLGASAAAEICCYVLMSE